MTKTISILGSTGSIGRQTLDVAEQLGLQVAALTAHASIERMEEQARRFRPRLAVLTDEAAARDLTVRLADTGTKVLGGPQGLEEAAALPEADTIVTAVVGMVRVGVELKGDQIIGIRLHAGQPVNDKLIGLPTVQAQLRQNVLQECGGVGTGDAEALGEIICCR